MAVAAHLLLENERGEVLFVRRANTGYADGQWSVPAGHVDAGETLIEASIRETAEELAIDLAESEVRPVLVQHKRDSDGEERIDFFFAASLPDGQTPVIAEPHKCDGLDWAPMGTPPEPLVEYVGAALAAVVEGKGTFLTYFGF
jgi:ADP-ribose pyrophosphatase YjhB (NUDIX family)